MKVAIIGPGVVGSAVALLLSKAGYEFIGVVGSNLQKAEVLAAQIGGRGTLEPREVVPNAELIIVTTPDAGIKKVTDVLIQKGCLRSGQVLIHMSGALSAAIMGDAREFGVYVASVHPLQSFASVEIAIKNLPKSSFALEGDNEALEVAEKIVNDLNGYPFRLAPGKKAIYHAGAVIASNYLVALTHLSMLLWEQAGIESDVAIQGLTTLLEGTLSNINRLGPVKALTGPIARGDWETVAGHLEKLDTNKDYLEMYKTLGRYTVDIALVKGTINREQADRLLSLLKTEGEAS